MAESCRDLKYPPPTATLEDDRNMPHAVERHLLFAAPGPLLPPSPHSLAQGCPECSKWQVSQTYTLDEALNRVKTGRPPDLLVIDIALSASRDMPSSTLSDPLHGLRSLLAVAGQAAVVALIPDGANALKLARQAFMAGAQDVLTRQDAMHTDVLVHALRNAVARKAASYVAEQMREDYVRLIDHAPIGIFRTSIDGRYLSVNPALAEMYGYDHPNELTDAFTDIGSQLYLDPSRRDEFARTLSFNGRLDGFESQIRQRDGSVIWISESARAVYDDDDNLLFYEGFVRNITLRKVAEEKLIRAYDTLEIRIQERTRQLREEITERRYAEESMRQAKEQAEAAAHSKSNFLANMSHELRTPLNAILGFSQVIEMADDSDTSENAGHIRRSGEHLLALINDLLDMAKVDAGHFELNDDDIHIASLIHDATIMVHPRADIQGCRVITDLPPNLPLLRGDPRRILQVLVNLATNAVKFTPADGTVTVSAEVAVTGNIVIRIDDTGCGMDPADIPRALSEFGQVGDATLRNQDGTGLGLPLARKLTELHGGTLSLESAVGEGTTVTVTFPKDRVVAAA